MAAWPHEKTELLRSMFGAGLRYSEIAAALDCTKDAVDSKIERLGLTRARAPIEQETWWTDDKIELFRQLWLDGLSCSRIAEALGCTKNAIVGKRKRLGLPERVGGRKMGMMPRAPGQRKTHPMAAHPRFQAVAPPPPRLMLVPIECARVSIVELNAGMCKWVLGDDCYCGNPAPGRAPYCVAHAEIAYVPAVSRNRLDRQLRTLEALAV